MKHLRFADKQKTNWVVAILTKAIKFFCLLLLIVTFATDVKLNTLGIGRSSDHLDLSLVKVLHFGCFFVSLFVYLSSSTFLSLSFSLSSLLTLISNRCFSIEEQKKQNWERILEFRKKNFISQDCCSKKRERRRRRRRKCIAKTFGFWMCHVRKQKTKKQCNVLLMMLPLLLLLRLFEMISRHESVLL